MITVIETVWAGIAQSIKPLAVDWMVRGSNPGKAEIFRACPARFWGPPSLLCEGRRVFVGSKMAGACR